MHRPPRRLHGRERLRPRDNRPENGTYRDAVAASIDPAVTRARFSAFVERTLEAARARGMTDRGIARESKVAASTFHRWRNGRWSEPPQLDKVRAFCAATGASLDEALAALGMTEKAPAATPEPPLPRDVRIILRRLADPNTPESEREFIRMSLQMLAGRAAASERSDERQRNAI